MKRLFWLGVGLAAGAYLTRRAADAAQHAAQQLTPAGIGANVADGLRELGAGIGAFGAEVRAGMVAREQELTELLERRTGAGVPTLVDALQDPAGQDPAGHDRIGHDPVGRYRAGGRVSGSAARSAHARVPRAREWQRRAPGAGA